MGLSGASSSLLLRLIIQLLNGAQGDRSFGSLLLLHVAQGEFHFFRTPVVPEYHSLVHTGTEETVVEFRFPEDTTGSKSAHFRTKTGPALALPKTAVDESAINAVFVNPGFGQAPDPDLVKLARTSIIRQILAKEAYLRPLLSFDLLAFEKKRQEWRMGEIDNGYVCTEIEGEPNDFGHQLGEAIFNLARDLAHARRDETAAGGAEAGTQLRVLNVGAGDGVTGDPLWPTVSRLNVLGLYLEASKDCGPQHPEVGWPDPDRIEFLCGMFVWPNNVERLLSASRMFAHSTAPQMSRGKLPGLDIVKIDIDTCDCEVASAILSAVEWVQVLVMEVNSLPPPIAFSFKSSFLNSTPWDGLSAHPLHGCSLSYQVRTFSRFGLKLFRYTGHDAVFLHRDLWDDLHQGRRGMKHRRNLGKQGSSHAYGFDEFACYEWSSVLSHKMIPLQHIQEWFFSSTAQEALQLVSRNLTRVLQSLIADALLPNPLGRPFSLSI